VSALLFWLALGAVLVGWAAQTDARRADS